MSFKNFLLLLLLLLCLSFRACNARRIGTHHRKLEKKIHISNQKGQKGLSVTLPSKKDHAGAATEDRIVETQVDNPTQNRKESKATATQMPIEDKKAAVQKESVVSFSWRVPRNKQKEKYPGFDSDYSPPKTHPPSHN